MTYEEIKRAVKCIRKLETIHGVSITLDRLNVQIGVYQRYHTRSWFVKDLDYYSGPEPQRKRTVVEFFT